jgi:hypothetical protein
MPGGHDQERRAELVKVHRVSIHRRTTEVGSADELMASPFSATNPASLAGSADRSPGMEVLDRLLLARADHRVMVCQGGYSVRSTFDRLASTVEDCKLTRAGDRYLLLFFNKSSRRFEALVYVAGNT